eukprot:5605232-Pyramimonas_sp.AAC.1
MPPDLTHWCLGPALLPSNVCPRVNVADNSTTFNVCFCQIAAFVAPAVTRISTARSLPRAAEARWRANSEWNQHRNDAIITARCRTPRPLTVTPDSAVPSVTPAPTDPELLRQRRAAMVSPPRSDRCRRRFPRLHS